MRNLKVILICLMLTVTATAVAGVPKSLKQAEKLAGNFDKLADARAKVQEALTDSTYTPDAYAYNVAGRVEAGAFRHYSRLLGINRNDPKVDRTLMADALLSARNYYHKALALDTVTDKKGNRKVNYSPKIANWLNAVTPSLYNAGVAYMNKRMYYPQAYSAFAAYAQAPEQYYYEGPEMTDSVKSAAWFYAGVMAYNASQLRVATEAFERARRLGYPKKEVLLNEISCLSRIAQAEPERGDSLSLLITRLAAEGHERFGLKEPLFIQKYVVGLVLEQKSDSAMAVVDSALVTNPASGMLHAMRGSLLFKGGNLEEAAKEYRLAADDEKAGFSTLAEASKIVAKAGIEQLQQVHGTRKVAREKRAKIKDDYLRPALVYARRARELKPDDPDLLNTLDTINYYLH